MNSIWFYSFLSYSDWRSSLHSEAAWGCVGCPPGQSQEHRRKWPSKAKYNAGRLPPALLSQCTVSGRSARYGCVPTWTTTRRTAALCDWAWQGSTSGPTPPWRCSWATPGCRGSAHQVQAFIHLLYLLFPEGSLKLSGWWLFKKTNAIHFQFLWFSLCVKTNIGVGGKIKFAGKHEYMKNTQIVSNFWVGVIGGGMTLFGSETNICLLAIACKGHFLPESSKVMRLQRHGHCDVITVL